MQREKISFSFEHKGQRPGTEFLKGGQGERVLGPSDAVLARLERKESVTLSEAREDDNGYLTRGMWQQCIGGRSLLGWAEKKLGNRPIKIWPVITYLYAFEVDEVVRLCYLLPLIEKAGLYSEEFWEKPQWLQISDLEALASLAEQGLLDLTALFEEKNVRFPNQRFDHFLLNRYGPKVIDKNLLREAESLLRLTGLDFWKEDLGQEITDKPINSP